MNWQEFLSQQNPQPQKPQIELDEFTRALTAAQIQQLHEHLATLQQNNGIANFYNLSLMFNVTLDDKRHVIQHLRKNLAELNEAFTLISDERVSRE